MIFSQLPPTERPTSNLAFSFDPVGGELWVVAGVSRTGGGQRTVLALTYSGAPPPGSSLQISSAAYNVTLVYVSAAPRTNREIRIGTVAETVARTVDALQALPELFGLLNAFIIGAVANDTLMLVAGASNVMSVGAAGGAESVISGTLIQAGEDTSLAEQQQFNNWRALLKIEVAFGRIVATVGTPPTLLDTPEWRYVTTLERAWGGSLDIPFDIAKILKGFTRFQLPRLDGPPIQHLTDMTVHYRLTAGQAYTGAPAGAIFGASTDARVAYPGVAAGQAQHPNNAAYWQSRTPGAPARGSFISPLVEDGVLYRPPNDDNALALVYAFFNHTAGGAPFGVWRRIEVLPAASANWIADTDASGETYFAIPGVTVGAAAPREGIVAGIYLVNVMSNLTFNQFTGRYGPLRAMRFSYRVGPARDPWFRLLIELDERTSDAQRVPIYWQNDLGGLDHYIFESRQDLTADRRAEAYAIQVDAPNYAGGWGRGESETPLLTAAPTRTYTVESGLASAAELDRIEGLVRTLRCWTLADATTATLSPAEAALLGVSVAGGPQWVALEIVRVAWERSGDGAPGSVRLDYRIAADQNNYQRA